MNNTILKLYIQILYRYSFCYYDAIYTKNTIHIIVLLSVIYYIVYSYDFQLKKIFVDIVYTIYIFI